MGGFNRAPLPGGAGGGDSALPAGPSSPAPSFSGSGGASFPSAGGASLEGLSSGDVKLSAPVGPGAVNSPDDVFRVESVLSDADLLHRPPGRTFKDDTFSAIKTAQARLNDNPRVDVGKTPLKLDGLVNPAGPTQAATRELAGDVVARRALPAPKPQPPKPGTAPLKVPAGPARVVATPAGPRRETLEQTVERVAKGNPLTAPKPPPKPAPESTMTGDQVAALERLAGGLSKVTHPGPVAKDIAGAFRNNAPGTVAEFKVVRNALEKTGTASQVNNLTEGVRAELTPEDRGRFDKLLAGTDSGDVQTPPLTGPGGEGKKDEKPGGKLPSPIRDVGPPTDKPVDRDQMLKKLGFDPDSKIGERLRASEAPLSAERAFELRKDADEKMEAEISKGRLPIGQPHDNKADAFRHAYWSYRTTQKIGPGGAKRFGESHEITERNKDSERLMDLYNNNVGRRLALDPANRGRKAEDVILEAIRKGQLQTRPFRIK